MEPLTSIMVVITSELELNLSNVTNMSSMFKNALSFDQDISNWFTTNVTDMSYMFSGARDFNQPLSGGNFVTTNVTTMKGMFEAPLGFNTTNFNNAFIIIGYSKGGGHEFYV